MDQGLFDDILKMSDLDATRNNRIKNANRKQNKQQPIPPQPIVDRGQYFLNSLHIDDPFSRLFPIQIDRICPGCPTVLVRNFDTNISFVTLDLIFAISQGILTGFSEDHYAVIDDISRNEVDMIDGRAGDPPQSLITGPADE